MSKLCQFTVVLSLAATLGGCGPEDLVDEAGGSTEAQQPTAGTTPAQDEPSLNTAGQELSSLGAYSWIGPADATSMGSAANRVCFFNRIRGSFAGAGQGVDIFGALGSWYLRGWGATRAVGRCAGLPVGSQVSGEYTWRAGQQVPTQLGSTTGRVCFLVSVTGNFNSLSDWARVYSSGGSWFLHGDSQDGTGRAQARCVSVGTYSGEYFWTSTRGYDTHMGSASGRVCALVGMAGRFKNVGDSVDVYYSAGSWYLGGGAVSATVHTRARCF